MWQDSAFHLSSLPVLYISFLDLRIRCELSLRKCKLRHDLLSSLGSHSYSNLHLLPPLTCYLAQSWPLKGLEGCAPGGLTLGYISSGLPPCTLVPLPCPSNRPSAC